jgi:hypothetical protein
MATVQGERGGAGGALMFGLNPYLDFEICFSITEKPKTPDFLGTPFFDPTTIYL